MGTWSVVPSRSSSTSGSMPFSPIAWATSRADIALPLAHSVLRNSPACDVRHHAGPKRALSCAWS